MKEDAAFLRQKQGEETPEFKQVGAGLAGLQVQGRAARAVYKAAHTKIPLPIPALPALPACACSCSPTLRL